MTGSVQFVRLLEQSHSGDAAALGEMLPRLYAELRALAEAQARHERPGHTLPATALVHEAYLRLVGQAHARWNSREHFMAVAAEVIRRVLVDHARSRGRAKRGGGRVRVGLTETPDARGAPDVDVLDLDAALAKLRAVSPDRARLVDLRFFGGLTVEEAARAMGTSPSSVEREWRFTRAWLFRELHGRAGGGPRGGVDGR